MTSVSLPIWAACPMCRHLMSVNLMDVAPRCVKCSAYWGTRYAYDSAMAVACGTPPPPYVAPTYTPVPPTPVYTPVPPPLPPVIPMVNDKYFTSGQFREEVENLVRRAIAEKMLNFTQQLCNEVQERTVRMDEDPDVQVKAVRELMLWHREEARMEWAEVAEDSDE